MLQNSAVGERVLKVAGLGRLTELFTEIRFGEALSSVRGRYLQALEKFSAPRPPVAVVCGIIKNEAPYIREWIAHYLTLGFDHIYLYDNDSTDDLRSSLSGIPSDKLTVTQWPRAAEGAPPQFSAYAHFLAGVACSDPWVFFVDADEFLVLHKHKSVKAWLRSLGDVHAVAINWRVFGDSGQTEYASEFVTIRFTLAAVENHPRNRTVKSLARASSILRASVHDHLLVESARVVSASGETLQQPYGPQTESVDHSVAQLNHYITKTREEWHRKRSRGRADKHLDEYDWRRTDSEFAQHNLNDVVDISAQKFLPKMLRLLARFDLAAKNRG